MINIKRFVCNPLQENCYVVSEPSGECVIIDCGAYSDTETASIDDYITDKALRPVHLLATHGHFDHNFGDAFITEKYGLKVELHPSDQQLVAHLVEQTAAMLGNAADIRPASIGKELKTSEVITFGQVKLEIIPTPGHSRGSVVFYCADERVAFTGDTLFRMSIGRTDFAEGNWHDMERSLQHLSHVLPATTRLYPGHGPESTMADELRYNPFLRM